MYNKKRNRLLFLGLIALGAIYWWSENRSSSSQDRTYRETLLEVVPDDVSSIEITSEVSGASKIELKKESGIWTVSNGTLKFNADEETVNLFLGKVEFVETDRYVGSKAETHARYGLGKGQGYDCVIKTNNGNTHQFKVGQLTFTNDAQGNQSGKITYLMVDGGSEVYAGKTDVGNDIQTEFDHWRPRSLWKGSNAEWDKLILIEGESSMTLRKEGEVWMMASDTVIADRMQSYIDGIATGKVALFDNEAKVEQGQDPIKQIVIYDALLDGPRSIRVYEKQNGSMFMVSDENPESFFEFDMQRAYRKLFRPPSYFVPLEKLKDNPELM